MPLRTALLKKVKARPGKSIAQCPACAEAGGDRKGVHLVVYPDGSFGCVASPNDKAHRRRIAELAGDKSFTTKPWQFKPKAKPVLADVASSTRPTQPNQKACAVPIPSLAVDALRRPKQSGKQPSEPSEPPTATPVSYASHASFPYSDKEMSAAVPVTAPVQVVSSPYAINKETASGAYEDIIPRATAMFGGKVRRFAPGTLLPLSLADVLRGWKHCPSSVLLPPAQSGLLGWDRKGSPVYARKPN